MINTISLFLKYSKFLIFIFKYLSLFSYRQIFFSAEPSKIGAEDHLTSRQVVQLVTRLERCPKSLVSCW